MFLLTRCKNKLFTKAHSVQANLFIGTSYYSLLIFKKQIVVESFFKDINQLQVLNAGSYYTENFIAYTKHINIVSGQEFV